MGGCRCSAGDHVALAEAIARVLDDPHWRRRSRAWSAACP